MSARTANDERWTIVLRLLARGAAFGFPLAACSASSGQGRVEPAAPVAQDAPLVEAQPGAWFDARGGLTVVGPGRRLRIALSAPIAACSPAFETEASPAERALHASLPYHVLSEACRDAHPAILLPEESQTASPAELERSYHEVARCVASELTATSGWIPNVVEAGDPCPAALGQGFRLPTVVELAGLTLDDRKAIAGALFDTGDRADFGSLLLYAKDATGALVLVTLSPNAAEQAPALTEGRRFRPFFGAALRCVRPATTDAEIDRLTPRLPHAASCLRELRDEHSAQRARTAGPATPELGSLKAWVEQASRTPSVLQNEASMRELSELLAAPAIERLARDAQSERALTEHYAELAEGLDDPQVSPGERDRRRAEFDSLRRRLGGQLVQGGQAGGERTQLSALVAHLTQLLEETTDQGKTAKAGRRARPINYAPVLERLRTLSGERTKSP